MKRALLLFAIVGGAGAGFAGAVAAQKPAAAAEATVTMSPFEVQAMSVEFKSWIKVSSPNFTVYTDASGAEASRVLRELEMLHAAGQRFFGRRALNFPPVTVILPTASSDWRKLESKGQVEWKAAVSTEADEIAELMIVQYDWQDRGLSVVRAAQAGCESLRLNLRGPFWFQRGLHTFFETAEFDKDSVGLGRMNPRLLHLQHAAWLPWGRFFAVDARSPEFTKEKLIHQYEAQTTVFSHFLFTNPERAWVGRLTAWLDYLNAGHAPTEAEFKAVFTEDWTAWQKTMERYIEDGSYRIYAVKVPPETLRYTETKVTPPVREMRDLFVLAQILVQSVPASEASLDAVLERGLKTEALRELLVAGCRQWKRPDAALENLRRLIAAGSRNPRVYTLAASQVTDRQAPRITLDARLGDEASEARNWCRRALELEPLMMEANVTLAWAEALAWWQEERGPADRPEGIGVEVSTGSGVWRTLRHPGG